MKKTIILISLFLITIIFSTFGQNSKLEVGVEAGAGLSTMWGYDYLKESAIHKVGWMSGVSAQYYFTSQFSIRTGVMYERNGAAAEYEVFDFDGNSLGMIKDYIDQDYLLIPLQFRFYFGDKVGFFCEAGFYGGWNLKVTRKLEGYETGEDEITDSSKKMDMGLIGGVGIKFPIKDIVTLTIELKDHLGVYDISTLPVINDGSRRNHSMMLSLGVDYPLGSKK